MLDKRDGSKDLNFLSSLDLPVASSSSASPLNQKKQLWKVGHLDLSPWAQDLASESCHREIQLLHGWGYWHSLFSSDETVTSGLSVLPSVWSSPRSLLETVFDVFFRGWLAWIAAIFCVNLRYQENSLLLTSPNCFQFSDVLWQTHHEHMASRWRITFVRTVLDEIRVQGPPYSSKTCKQQMFKLIIKIWDGFNFKSYLLKQALNLQMTLR